MNHKNGKPQDSAIQDCFCCAPCTMPVPIQPGTQTRGGVYQDSVMRCTSTIVPIYLPQRGLSVIARPARSDPAEKGRTGATQHPMGENQKQPFQVIQPVSAGRISRIGGVYQPVYHRLPAPFSGVAPVRPSPPFCRCIGKRGGGGVPAGVPPPTPLFRGRSRPIYPYGKVPNTYPKRALTRRRQAP